MGAKCIYDIAIENTSASMAEREIIRRVEAHTGRRVDRWEVSCSLYSSNDKKRPALEIVSFSDVSSKLFTRFKGMVMESDQGFLNVVRKMSGYQLRSTRLIKGAEYDFVDFRVRVGVVMDRHGIPKGVVVEIEYRPCPVTADCERLIGELMERIAAPLVPPPQTSGDPAVSAAATTAYNYNRVELDVSTVNPKDLNPFSHRTAAILYAKLLK
eukprot:GFKZ01003710.1.p1 GENE.GFKZ01003710.1~~GFKZ01003710.1.p1  ORF type:complete len:212 (-),score=28.94 GFKZ01003710.1:279-914(-)